jgi:hypothetical protein
MTSPLNHNSLYADLARIRQNVVKVCILSSS